MERNESAVDWRIPTIDELREWLECRPRVGKLLWRKPVTRSKTAWHQPYRNREKVYGEPSQGDWQKTVSWKLQATATPYSVGSSAIIKDRYDELIVIIPGLKRVRAHHVVWAMVHGEWPKGRLLFKDGNKRNIAAHNLVEDSRGARDQRAVRRNVRGKLKSLKVPTRGAIQEAVMTALPPPKAKPHTGRTAAILAAFSDERVRQHREVVAREVDHAVRRGEEVGAAAYRMARKGSSVEQFMRKRRVAPNGNK